MRSKNKQERFWFYLEPYVHYRVKEREAVLYNTLTGKYLEVADKKHLQILEKIKKKRTHGALLMKDSDLKDASTLDFIQRVRAAMMGDLLPGMPNGGKPFVFRPRVKIQRSFGDHDPLLQPHLGENILSYLKEVSLYINNLERDDIPGYGDAHRQFLFHCPAGTPRKEIAFELIEQLIAKDLQGSYLQQVNILGSNIFKYPNFNSLVDLLNGENKKINYYVHYKGLSQYANKIEQVETEHAHFNFQVDAPVCQKSMQEALEIAQQKQLSHRFDFAVRNEEELANCSGYIDSNKISGYMIKPYFSRGNEDFFEKYVYIQREHLFGVKLTQQELYEKEEIHPTNFGRLTIVPPAKVYANVNEKSIGVLGKDSITEIIYKELVKGKSWRKMRKNVSPCKGCGFDIFCPPISNYEYAIGKHNLCRIWKESKCRTATV